MTNCCVGSSCGLCKVACWIVLIGALNMGLVGVEGFVGANLDVVNIVLGSFPKVESVFYVLVGIGALMEIFKCCPVCRKK